MTSPYSQVDPANTIFALVSFEGPDPYSLAGGLGVRVSELAQSLAQHGFETHLIFVGDPSEERHELREAGRLHLWRVCREISRYMPAGVYEGEEGKLERFRQIVPSLVHEQIAIRTAEANQLLVVMGEDWHTAATMIEISDLLYWHGLRRRALLLWNANNTFGFTRIDWRRLTFTTQILTVSRYMQQLMKDQGVNPLVIPNGIPSRHLEAVQDARIERFRAQFAGRLTLTKVARFDPNKNWLQAVRAVRRLKALGLRPLLFMRGGVEGHGHEVLAEINTLGLQRCDLRLVNPSPERCLDAFDELPDCDAIFLRFFVPEEVQRLLYCGSDSVLANSSHEPFGLVGLEVMAAKGLAITGSTGEDYAQHLLNAIVLDTSDPDEIVGSQLYLRSNPAVAAELRRVAGLTSSFYVWDRVIEKLISKLQYLVMTQGLIFDGDRQC